MSHTYYMKDVDCFAVMELFGDNLTLQSVKDIFSVFHWNIIVGNQIRAR